jgi:DNA-binding NarL/FixJ family response regulator
MDTKIRVAILDDHLATVMGYVSLIMEQDSQIEVTAKMSYGEELEPTLEKNPVDVLMLDVTVPTSQENKNPYPILNMIPKLLQTYPSLNILVSSMHTDRGLIRAVMEAGANGYLLKDDQAALKSLGSVIRTVAGGGIHFSPVAHDLYKKSLSAQNDETLSPRESETLSLCAAYPDATTAEIAQKMKIKNPTVRNLLSNAYVKLGVRSRAAAIAKARELGLITPYPPEPPK